MNGWSLDWRGRLFRRRRRAIGVGCGLVLLAAGCWAAGLGALLMASTALPRAQLAAATVTAAPSAAPVSPDGMFALNHVGTAESDGLQISVVRAAFFTRAAMIQLDGNLGNASVAAFRDAPIFGEFVIRITNTTRQKLIIQPDRGQVVIGAEHIELGQYLNRIGGLDDISGEIAPGVTKTGGFYFAVRQTPLQAITSARYAFGGPVDPRSQTVGNKYEFVLDLSRHEYEPAADALK